MSLRNTAAQLVQGTISLDAASEAARDAILGTRTTSSGITGRVLRGTAVVERDLSELAAYISQYSMSDPEKWAGTFLMLHVQFAIDDVSAAVRMSKSVVQVSRGSCPKPAKAFALAIVDAVLTRPDDLTPPEKELFRQARRSFSQV
jgi:hypothetical protein